MASGFSQDTEGDRRLTESEVAGDSDGDDDGDMVLVLKPGSLSTPKPTEMYEADWIYAKNLTGRNSQVPSRDNGSTK